MKESYSEGLATHAGPESCAGVRKGVGEVLTGVRAGRVSSREIGLTLGCRRCPETRKAIPVVSIARETAGPHAVQDPGHVRKHLTREPGAPVFVPRREGSRDRIGKSEDVRQ